MSEFQDNGVVPDRTYYFARKDDKLVYFLNGSLWNDGGERVSGRATCYTSANGRNLVELKAEFGRYDMDGRTLVTR
ncbi:MAG: hypothetical protein U5O39_01855 [Gammaproteobacteria bacterium]|nr:hypothetical protein [Gammaproteobacteria bacterium]